jgi:hypothetical protein
MDLTPYIESLRRELVMVAETGSDEMRDLAERLWAPLDSMTRLAMLEALSAAADEITGELAPGSVEVRLRGRDPEFVVTTPPADRSVDAAAAPTAPASGRSTTRRGAPRDSPSACRTTSSPTSTKLPPGPGCRSTPGWSGRWPPPSSPRPSAAGAAR